MPQSSKRTRERQLAKLAERRAAERRRKRRNRAVALGSGGVAAAVAILVLFLVFHNTSGSKSSAAASTKTPTPTPSATATAATPTGVACGGTVPNAASKTKPVFTKAPAQAISDTKTYEATFDTSCGTFVVKFDQASAPNTVNSLVFLIQHHFYDGLTFHRISRGFVIQGGDPKGDGTGGPGYTTVDAPPANAQYPVGTIAMAKTGSDPNGTSGSQFFVVTSSTAQQALAPNGTGQYAIVGHVVSGLDVVQKIAALPILNGATDGQPAQHVYIVKVTLKVS
jgi:peptidyl-prolyl cis-trans isomerase B (cyclophilin B)